MKLQLDERLEALFETLDENGYQPEVRVKGNKVTLTMTARDYKEALHVVNLCWKLKQKHEK